MTGLFLPRDHRILPHSKGGHYTSFLNLYNSVSSKPRYSTSSVNPQSIPSTKSQVLLPVAAYCFVLAQVINVFPAQRIHHLHLRPRRQLLGCYYQVLKLSRLVCVPRPHHVATTPVVCSWSHGPSHHHAKSFCVLAHVFRTQRGIQPKATLFQCI